MEDKKGAKERLDAFTDFLRREERSKSTVEKYSREISLFLQWLDGRSIDQEQVHFGTGKEQTATFIGHKECYGVQTEEVQREIEKIIALGVTDFLNGGMGGFDWMCARIVYDLKKSYPQIKNYLVIPYLTFNIAEPKYFDATIYPEGFEKYHFKAAIPARNRYLVDNSTYAICYVTHDWGGAAKTLQRATKKGLTIINLGERKDGRDHL